MSSDSSPQDRQLFMDALASSLESLGTAKDLVFKYLEDRQLMSFRDGKPPSMEQLGDALRGILGSGADVIIQSLKEKLESSNIKALWPSAAALSAYASCLFGCAGLLCCRIIGVCKMGMTSSM
jgi:hypothetical protein